MIIIINCVCVCVYIYIMVITSRNTADKNVNECNKW